MNDAPQTRVCSSPRRPAFWIPILVGLLTALSSALDADTSTAPQPTFKAEPFRVAVHGPNAARPVLLIPGLGSPGSVWDATVERLVREGYQAHVFTLAGFAGQPPIAGEWLPQVHAALLDYARRFDESPAVIGHSLGGVLALWLAADEPERFGPIVAVDGVPFLPALQQPGATESSARPFAEQLRARIAGMTPAEYDQQTAFTLSTMIRDPEQTRQVAAASRGSDPATIASAMYDLMTRDLRDDIAAIRSPVLLLAAGASAPSEDAARILRRAYASQVKAIPDHRVEWIADARHFVMLDAPERFEGLMLEHLERP